MKFFKNKFTARYLLFTIILAGIFLRFYNLNWGAPFYFHPDERNIASSIIQLNFPTQLNPHFFAYGSLPIYLIYLTNLLLKTLFNFPVSFPNVILLSRFYSVLFSVLLIPLIYFICQKIKVDNRISLLTAFLTATSVGFIQFAHFGTFEMWLSFFGALLFYQCLMIIEKPDKKNLIFSGILLGILLAIKISSAVLIPISLLALFFSYGLRSHSKYIGMLGVALFILFLSSPFILFDFPSFLSSLRYESSVAFGTLPVFYTGGFYNTLSIFFQLTKVYPFLLNPIITLIFIPSVIYVTYSAIKKKNNYYYLLLGIYYLLFLSPAFFFAKWTRYMVPTLPFIYLIIAVFLDKVLEATKRNLVLVPLALVNFLFAFSFFATVYLKNDTRIIASFWAKNNLPQNAKILSELYDLGVVPFNQNFANITLFNFYDLELNQEKGNEFSLMLNNYNYLILPSQRIMRNRLLNKNQFPEGNHFYKFLFEGKLVYKKIYETPCDLLCHIAYLNDPIFSFEETASVFDRPTIYIFKK